MFTRHMTRGRIIALSGIFGAALLASAGVAGAAVAGGPPYTNPSATAGPYYSGPVHECVSTSNEGAVYVEEHSSALGNCAAGYRQITVNELSPSFTLQLQGGPVQDCTAAELGAQTAVTCTVPAS